MKRKLIPLLFIFLFFGACSQNEQENGRILARINEYKLFYDEYQKLLSQEVEQYPDVKLTRAGREQFLEELIRKELLIQEAKRLKLDQREKFIRTIERYWEATLIRDLMEFKGKEIEATTLPTQEEIDAKLANLSPAEKSQYTPDELNERIAADLNEEKKRERLKQWIETLRKEAHIEINKDLL